MNDTCMIVCGLLPYYVRDGCPRDLREMVARHMHTCNKCRTEFERLGGRFDRKGNPRLKQRIVRHVISVLLGIFIMTAAFVLLLYLLAVILTGKSLQSGNPYYKPSFGQLTGEGAKTQIKLLIGICAIAIIMFILWKFLSFIYKKLFPVHAPVFETYTVQSGDTLWAIAEKFYGDGERSTLLKLLNGDTGQAAPGKVLRIRLKQPRDS